MRSEPFERIHQALLTLNKNSLQAWQDFATQWQLHEWVQANGSLLTVENPNSIEMLTKHSQRLNDIGVVNELLTKNALQERLSLPCKTIQLAALFS